MPAVAPRVRLHHAVAPVPSRRHAQRRRRMQLLNWAANSGTWIIEDDYDSEYRFAAAHRLPAGSGYRRRVIYVGTFSKVMFPAMRLGYLVLPKDLVPAFAVAREATDTCSSACIRRLCDFIREGAFRAHIGRMRNYTRNAEGRCEAIQQQLDGRLEVLGPKRACSSRFAAARCGRRGGGEEGGEKGSVSQALSGCYLHAPARGGSSWLRRRGRAAIREAVQTLATCI